MIFKNMYLNACAIALTVGCTTADDARTSVETNELGVTSIEVAKHGEGNTRVLEVRGFDDGDNQIATLRWKVGTIDDLMQWLPDAEDGSLGSEITLSVAGTDTRMLTRETRMLALDTPDDHATAVFVQLPAVSSALAAVNMTFEIEAQAEPTTETAYDAYSCPNYYLLTTPVAQQCCYGTSGPPSSTAAYTHFINPNNALVKRRRNLVNGSGCKALDGVSACAGTSCYYGPQAFGRPVLTVPPAGYPYWYIEPLYNDVYAKYSCSMTSHSSNVGQYFPNVTGTLATGQGCPGGGTGAGQWDY